MPGVTLTERLFAERLFTALLPRNLDLPRPFEVGPTLIESTVEVEGEILRCSIILHGVANSFTPDGRVAGYAIRWNFSYHQEPLPRYERYEEPPPPYQPPSPTGPPPSYTATLLADALDRRAACLEVSSTAGAIGRRTQTFPEGDASAAAIPAVPAGPSASSSNNNKDDGTLYSSSAPVSPGSNTIFYQGRQIRLPPRLRPRDPSRIEDAEEDQKGR